MTQEQTHGRGVTAGAKIARSTAVALFVVSPGCTWFAGQRGLEQPAVAETSFAHQWAAAIYEIGRLPVLPPTEDVSVGDVYALAAPPDFDVLAKAGGLRLGATSRWTSLQVPGSRRAEDRERSSWSHISQPKARRAAVDLRMMAAEVALGGRELEPWLPVEVTALIEHPATPGGVRLSLQVSAAESEALPVDLLLEQLIAAGDAGGHSALRPARLRDLPSVPDSGTDKAYLVVVSDVVYIRRLDATIRRRQTAPPGARDVAMLAASQRAREMNAALAQSGVEDGISGAVQFVTVTDDAMTLRRSWQTPLAVAVRGVTLEVDVSSGEVVRMGPIGLELPALLAVQDDSAGVDESEVLEERRRGAAAQPVARARKGARLYWDYGPRLDALDGELTLVVGGRLHLDAATFSDDEQIDTAFGEPDPGIDVRRAFLQFGGVYRQFDFNFWLNFSDGSNADFRDVFVGMRGLPVVGSVRAGYFKEPFGLEEITSSNDITLMERSLTNAFVEGRNLGVMFQRRFTEKRHMTAALGFFRDADNDLDLGTGYAVTGRITGAPILSDDGRHVLHLGGSATYRRPGDDGVSFASRPESAQAQILVDTGTFAADQELRVGAEVAAVMGSFSLQSEAIVAASHGTAGAGDPLFWSAYLAGSYVLTGEHRAYRDRVGAFGAVQPEDPFWWKGAGAVELTARYSFLDLDSAAINGGALHDWTLGLNWYANQQARVMFNYIVAHPEGFGFENILQARLQFSF